MGFGLFRGEQTFAYQFVCHGVVVGQPGAAAIPDQKGWTVAQIANIHPVGHHKSHHRGGAHPLHGGV